MEKITSLQNPKIKEVNRLANQENYRKKSKLVLVEGKEEVRIALENLEVVNYFFCPELTDKYPEVDDEKILETNKEVFKKISYRKNPDGHIAIFKEKKNTFLDIKLKKNPLIVILDKIEKPGNLGAIIRTICAIKADAVILVDNQLDIYNSNVIRSSTGHIFKTKIVSDSFENTLKWLKDNDIKIFSTNSKTNISFVDVDYTGATAIVFGSENKGLDERWFKVSDKQIKIPMLEEMDSLNLSVSVAIISFEALKQRKLL
ncbi:RNA methyltransferase [bacterium]|nr:RNA methyltransferase [bacterium]